MSNGSRKSVRWEDKRSGSSRASTTGGSSSGSSYSEYTDHRYNIAALEETLQSTVNELDEWKRKALEAEEQLRKYQKEIKEAKGRISGLERRIETLEDEQKDAERNSKTLREENKALKEKCAGLQKKVTKYEGKSDSPSSPDTAKPRRRESNSPRESDTDRHNARLKERFNRSGDSTTSEGSSSKPPSSSRATRGSRRMSTSERPYVEEWGPPGPTAPLQTSPAATSTRRPENYITTNMANYPIATAPISGPGISSTPRSAGGMQRPTVEFTTYANMPAYAPNVPVYPEDGNYHAHPLPPEPRRRH